MSPAVKSVSIVSSSTRMGITELFPPQCMPIGWWCSTCGVYSLTDDCACTLALSQKDITPQPVDKPNNGCRSCGDGSSNWICADCSRG